jgi:hypothetical protein
MLDAIDFRIVPIDAGLADQVRREQRSPQYGHPATVEVAKGYGPCRQCLRTFRAGEEERILFTYDPVPKGRGLPQPGPVFIHKASCAPFAGPGVPPELRGLPLFLEGFGRGTLLSLPPRSRARRRGRPWVRAAANSRRWARRGAARRAAWVVRREPVDVDAIEADIAAMLRDPAIELVQLRNAEAGCFVARVVRT